MTGEGTGKREREDFLCIVCGEEMGRRAYGVCTLFLYIRTVRGIDRR